MSTYVMSDLHGEADLFHAMLKKVNFSESDRLIVLGDVIDRGSSGIAMLHEIMDSQNIDMLLGNHEYMMMQYYDPGATAVELMRWRKNGNGPTVAAFESLPSSAQERILGYLSSLETHRRIHVNDREFYLVHGFPGENVHDVVWCRPAIDAQNPIQDAVLIIGHTPVLHLIADREERDSVQQQLISGSEHPRICHASGFVDIDCGCTYQTPLKTLGCLRLDDMEEFYVYG